MLATIFAAGGSHALVTYNPSAIYSYFEGMRGYFSISTPALTDDALAVWLNPPALGTEKASGLAYAHSFTDSTFSGDDAVGFAVGPFGFGMEFMKLREPELSLDRQSVSKYTISFGGRLVRNLYLGGSYAWLNSDIPDLDRGSTWSLGLMWRPHRMVSLGLLGRDLNSPTYYGNKFRPIIETSLGVRPFDERLTLFTNVLLRDQKMEIRTAVGDLIETQPTTFFNFGIEARPWPGINLLGTYDEDGNWSLAVALPGGMGTLGTVMTTEKDSSPYRSRTYGVVGLTTSPFWHETILNPLKQYVEIDMSGSIGEAPAPFSFFGGGPRYTTRELLDKIKYAAESREIEAILIRMGDISTSLAIADELRQAIADFRATGKKVIVYANTPKNREYYLATASDYIILAPNGYLGLNGLKVDVFFAGGTLEKLGIEPHYTRVGKYKSAAEQIAHDSFTEPSREALSAVLDDVYAKFIEDIAAGRGIQKDDVRSLIDKGPYVPTDALRLGLVDRLAYWDEVPDIVDEVLKTSSHKLAYKDFVKRKPPQPRWSEPPVIGIVYGTGMILEGSNRRDPLLGDIMGPRTMASALKSMREDKSVKAVIFRIDSGGGEMAAADQIRREVELTAKEKPVIVSMSGVAGSGGYHIACNGTRILADEATLTGSIGVINMWFHTRGLYEKLGLNKEIFWRGENADIFPSWREVTEEDLAMSHYFSDKFYDKFVDDVAAGRSMAPDAVNEIAQGRIWSGRSAKGIGLVDDIGGLAEAIRLAKQDAGISPREEVAFKVLPKPLGFWDMLTGRIEEGLTPGIKVPEPVEGLLGEAAYFELIQREPNLYLMPYRIEVE